MSEDWPDQGETLTRPTGRWRGVAAVALALGVLGVFLREPGVVLAATVGIALAGYARAVDPPAATVAVERSVSEGDGDRLEIDLTVTNEGDRRLSDLRVVDGVPASAFVVEGAPACRTTLAAGESTRVSYAVETGRGAAAFRPALVAVRDAAGTVERAVRVEARGDTAVERAPAFERVSVAPLRASTATDAGRRTVEQSGSGVAFQLLREHRAGDPLSRVAWAQWAKTGEPATVEFQPERAASVVLVLDTRPAARLAPGPKTSTAVQRSADAAARLFGTLDEAGDRVGIATLDDGRRWLSPGRGRSHRARARDLLTDESLARGSAGSFDPAGTAGWLAERLPAAAQAVVLTPLCDDGIERFVTRLDALGVPATVCSPDPTAADTAGRRLARAERDRRCRRLRRAGIEVVDWRPEGSLDRALARRAEL